MRLLLDRGRPDKGSVRDAWLKALRSQYAADPFITFREVHRAVFQDLFRRFGIQSDVDSCIDEAFDEYRRATAFPEVTSVLRDLEPDIPMAVVSNMDTAILLEALHRNGLSFTFVVASEEEQRYKPHASLFQRAIRYLGLPAGNLLHAGDSYPEDVVGATSVGMGAALVHRATDPLPDIGKTGRVIRDLRELPSLIRHSWS